MSQLPAADALGRAFQRPGDRSARELAVFFAVVYGLLWGGSLVILTIRHLRSEAFAAIDALILFPIGVLGVAAAGVSLTASWQGSDGVRELLRRLGRWRVAPRDYAVALLLPPILVWTTLSLLQRTAGPFYAPNRFFVGILFGLLPGFAEEVGWTGLALPRLLAHGAPLAAAVQLGLLWSLWHLPVVNFLGAAAPHGAHWLAFFLSFAAVLVPMRVLMVWLYGRSQSVLLAQLMHASSTASLVVLGPAHVSPAQEALWYGCYGAALWIALVVLVGFAGRSLGLRPASN